MLGRLFNKISGLIRKGREYCLVVEQLDDRLETTRAKIFSLNKKLIILKRKKVSAWSKLKKPLFFLDKLILALDHHHATTIESVIRLKRPKPNELIDEDELDHLLFRGLWEFLNHYRTWSAKKMDVSDSELVLANIGVRDVGLGSHRAFNPIGFKGGEFFVRLRGTFVSRSFLDTIARMRNWAREIIIVEAPSIVSASVPEPADFVVHLAESRTTVFSSNDEERLYSKECLWGSTNVVQAVAKTFAVDEETADLIIGRYLQNKVSDRIRRIVDLQVNTQFRILLEMLESVYNKSGNPIARPAVHFNFRFAMPPPRPILENSRLRLVNFVRALELQGYNIIFRDPVNFNPKIHQSTLALLVHPYYDEHHEFLNQLLRRRVKWLIAYP